VVLRQRDGHVAAPVVAAGAAVGARGICDLPMAK